MAKVIVVTSGKGGVGKTTTSANVAAGLAALGHRTIAIDFDVGLRNLDLVMGCERRVVYDEKGAAIAVAGNGGGKGKAQGRCNGKGQGQGRGNGTCKRQGQGQGKGNGNCKGQGQGQGSGQASYKSAGPDPEDG